MAQRARQNFLPNTEKFFRQGTNNDQNEQFTATTSRDIRLDRKRGNGL